MGRLYIVSTPIGNLDDITVRAINILFSVDSIACEDTRRTGLLMKLLKEKYKDTLLINSKVKTHHFISYYEQNEQIRIPQIINALKNGLNIALVSDAGTPTISDPGFKLIRECIKENIKIESIPGPSAVVSALTVSGLPTDKFLFIGYPPKKPGHRKKLFEDLKKSGEFIKFTIIFFESPYKLMVTLGDLQSVFGDIEIVLVRELTKIHESRISARISSFIEGFSKAGPKGEYVILINTLT